jgi:ParB family chromosome partitioning protein
VQEVPSLQEIPVEAVLSNPFQARLAVSEEELAELTETVKQYGVLQPILVRPKPGDRYEIIAGERRLAAAKRAGLIMIPAMIQDIDDKTARKLSFIENLQRKDLSDYEKALVLKEMLKDYPSQEALAKEIGKSPAWISRHLAMLELVDKCKEKLPRGNLEKLTERHARMVLSAPVEQREQLLKEIVQEIEEKGEIPSTREIERKIKKPSVPEEAPAPVCEVCGKSEPKPEFMLTDQAGKVHYYHALCRKKSLQEEQPPSGPPSPPTPPPTKKFVIDLDYGLYEQFEKACRILGRSPTEVITTFIATFIEEAARKQAALARPNESDVPQLLLKYAKRDTMNGVGRVVLSEFLSETGVSDKEFWNAVHQLRNQGVQVRVQGNVVLVGG